MLWSFSSLLHFLMNKAKTPRSFMFNKLELESVHWNNKAKNKQQKQWPLNTRSYQPLHLLINQSYFLSFSLSSRRRQTSREPDETLLLCLLVTVSHHGFSSVRWDNILKKRHDKASWNPRQDPRKISSRSHCPTSVFPFISISQNGKHLPTFQYVRAQIYACTCV